MSKIKISTLFIVLYVSALIFGCGKNERVAENEQSEKEKIEISNSEKKIENVENNNELKEKRLKRY